MVLLMANSMPAYTAVQCVARVVPWLSGFGEIVPIPCALSGFSCCATGDTWPASLHYIGAPHDTTNEKRCFARTTARSGHVQPSFSRASRITALEEGSSFAGASSCSWSPRAFSVSNICRVRLQGPERLSFEIDISSCHRVPACESLDASLLDGTPYLGSCRPTTLDSACSINGTLLASKYCRPYR